MNDESRSLGIDFHYAKGGTVTVARCRAQLERAAKELAAAKRLGLAEETSGSSVPTRHGAELNATDVLGALVNPHCAAIHPARLARGLADIRRATFGQDLRVDPRRRRSLLTGSIPIAGPSARRSSCEPPRVSRHN